MQPDSSTRVAHNRQARFLRIAITAVALGLWFWTQSLIGSRQLSGNEITDVAHQWTAPINSYLLAHPRATDALLVISSAFIDAFGLLLLFAWIFGRSVRPFLSLLLVMGLRQFMQGMCALPAPHGIIWHDPGFPSLLVTYKVANDFFFSGHTTIAVLGAYEVSRLRRRWLTVPACMVLVFEILTVLSLRVHYTMDVFTGIVTALLVSRLSSRIAPAIDHRLLGRQQVKDCNGRISGLSSAQKSMPQVDSTRLPARSAATNSASF